MTDNTSRPAQPGMLLLRLLLLGLAIPALLGIFTYVGFFTNYTTAVFHQAGFEQQYLHTSIYRFRILGSHLLLWIYEHIKDWPLTDFAPYALKSLDHQGDPNFYYAYFLLNTAFLCATCSALVIAFQRFARSIDFIHVDLPVLCLALLMSFAQYVITPYDTLSCFFLGASLPFCMKERLSIPELAIFCLVMVLGTLSRETSALILSLYFAVHHRRILQRTFTRAQLNLLLLTITFLLTYGVLRWQLGMEDATHHRFRLLRNFSDDPLPIIGGIFLPCLLALFFTDATNRTALRMFLIASLPYTLMMFAVAYPWEIRLWVPLFLLMTFLKLAELPVSQEKPAT